MRLSAILVPLCTFAALTTPVGAATITTPSLVEGNDNNCYPFSCGGTPYQQLYSFDYFSEPTLITAMAFRADARSGGAFTSTFSNVDVQLGTTTVDPDAPATSFVVGTGMTTVRSGALSVSTAGTGAFDLILSFATPFLYDPSAGNLLFQFAYTGAVDVVTSGSNTQMDASFLSDDGMSRRFFGGGGDTLGLVTQFHVAPAPPTAVPEPGSTLLLLGLGFAVTGVARWRQGHA